MVVHFSGGFLGRGFLGIPEAAAVARLLERAFRGLAFPPAVRRRLGRAIITLGRLSGLRQTLALAELLQILAESPAQAISRSLEDTSDLTTQEDERSERIVGWIRDSLPDPIRRAELARMIGVSERSLSRIFRSRFGKTLPRFVNELRVGRARDLLLETSESITRIAEDCGFQNLSNFNAQFRRLCGIAPQAFRLGAHDGAVEPSRKARQVRGKPEARRRSRGVRARETT